MRVRRYAGGFAMILGAVVFLAMASLASIAIANYVEWDNAADAVRTVAAVTIPPAGAGVALVLLGRWIYGGLRYRSPIRAAAGLATGILGLLMILIFGAELAQLFLAGLTTEDETARAVLGVGAILGLSFVFLGVRIGAGGHASRAEAP